ncbi:unnamed protein product [Camellia sinensis]
MPVLAKMTSSVSESILSSPTMSSDLLDDLVVAVLPESHANIRTLGMRKTPEI